MGILSKQNIHIAAENDQVLLMVGNLVVNMPYAACFKIAQCIRLVSKDSMRYAKEDVTGWSTFAESEDMPERTVPYPIANQKRVSVGGDFKWGVSRNGENVKVLFGNNELQFHFTAALQIQAWLRLAGTEARAWAGDSGKTMIAASILSDAEENYRLGIQ